ncbi:uncharacterized protein A4U43_C09F14520 [Asparagus officinalis]|uniref:Condensin complex subunit 1 C-terminal domain-containing protein n=2 Tax=Asparagus officinalis TaxID=4686 RepID=A0A5P1E7Z4_ASPOF|nr:uncharacterized protein A4U43_C09F14520 [Asparagus officinalis]
MMDYMEGDRNSQPAIGLLRNLASLKYISDIIQSSELFIRVILELDSSSPGTRTEAARAITELNSKSRKEIVNAIPKLVRMMEAKGSEEKEAAAEALASILKSSSGMKREFRKEERGIVNAVMLLDPLVGDVEKKYVIEVLLSVSQSRKSRRQMVALGACVFLKRLAGMEVEGAKKLLECLEKGKFLGVFPRN